jgi:hypothetical protein
MENKKLSLLRQLEDDEDILDLNEAFKDIFVQPGTVMNTVVKGVKGGVDFMKRHPALSVGALITALDWYEQYRNNQKYSTRLFGKTPEEKKFYKAMVDDLVKTGRWKVVKNQTTNGGQLWVMRRLTEGQELYDAELEELKRNRRPLSPSEKREAMAAGCVWHTGPGGKTSCAIWRSVRGGKSVFVSNTSRCYRVSDTLKDAIKEFEFVRSTS